LLTLRLSRLERPESETLKLKCRDLLQLPEALTARPCLCYYKTYGTFLSPPPAIAEHLRFTIWGSFPDLALTSRSASAVSGSEGPSPRTLSPRAHIKRWPLRCPSVRRRLKYCSPSLSRALEFALRSRPPREAVGTCIAKSLQRTIIVTHGCLRRRRYWPRQPSSSMTAVYCVWPVRRSFIRRPSGGGRAAQAPKMSARACGCRQLDRHRRWPDT